MRNRFPDLISLNPNKLPRQLYLPSRSTCARLSAISHNLHRVHWFPVNIARYRPAHCRSRMPITVTASDHRDQCRCVTQRHVGALSIHAYTLANYLFKVKQARVPQNYEHLRARARARERRHTEIHTYRGPIHMQHWRERPTPRRQTHPPERLHRLTSIPRRVPRSPPSFNHPSPPVPRARGIPIAAPVSQTHTLHTPRYPPTSPFLTLVLYLLSVLSNRGSSLLHHSSRPDPFPPPRATSSTNLQLLRTGATLELSPKSSLTF